MKNPALTVLVTAVFAGLVVGSVYVFRPTSQPTGGTLTVTVQPVMYEGVVVSCQSAFGTATTVTYWLPGGYTSETMVTPTTASRTIIVTTTTVTAAGLSMIGLTQSSQLEC